MTSDGTVKFTDFGIAAAVDATAGDTAENGISVGCPAAGSGEAGAGAYVSPEQAVGLPAGPASDLYGLGCVLHELLVGIPLRP